MRKILFIFIVLFTYTATYAQKVSIDKMENDGSRVITSEASNLYRKLVSAAGFHLSYVLLSSGNEFWYIQLTLNEGKYTMDKGRKLLIKTDKDEIIELENYKVIGPADYEYNVTRYGTDYYIKPGYNISEEQIKQLCSSNVVKIRIETNIENIDREIKPKKFAKAIKEMYDAICKAKSQSKTVYDGF